MAARGKAAGGDGLQRLVIVESPAKGKKIGDFLGPNYTVRASMGHIRDLPSRDNPLPEADMWGAGSIDENSDIHIINDLRLPMAFRLIPRDKAPPYPRQQSGHAPYAPQCGTPWALA